MRKGLRISALTVVATIAASLITSPASASHHRYYGAGCGYYGGGWGLLLWRWVSSLWMVWAPWRAWG